MTEQEGVLDLLSSHAFFAGLDARDVAYIADCGHNVVFEPGQHVFHEDEPASYFYIIRHGRVALEVYAPNKGPILIETLGEDEVLGWSWLFPPYKWSSDARAVELTRAIALDARCMREKCDEDPRLGYELTKRFGHIMMHRLTATRLRLLDFYGDGRDP